MTCAGSFPLNILRHIGRPKPDGCDVEFVNLGVHTPYELLNASGDIGAWVRKAKWMGHTALGLCDRNTMAGTLAFQKECAKAGIKRVFGYSLTLDGDGTEVPLKVYCQSQQGLQNLLRIQKAVMVDREDGRIDMERLMAPRTRQCPRAWNARSGVDDGEPPGHRATARSLRGPLLPDRSHGVQGRPYRRAAAGEYAAILPRVLQERRVRGGTGADSPIATTSTKPTPAAKSYSTRSPRAPRTSRATNSISDPPESFGTSCGRCSTPSGGMWTNCSGGCAAIRS